MPSREASLRNLEKAKARWRAPRPWRCGRETRIIKQLVWQWWSCPVAKMSCRAVARTLGVSHTYVRKLVRQFAHDPSSVIREGRLHGEATLEQLARAQQETKKQRERGWLRCPRLWKTVEFKVGNNVVRTVVRTKAGLPGLGGCTRAPQDAQQEHESCESAEEAAAREADLKLE